MDTKVRIGFLLCGLCGLCGQSAHAQSPDAGTQVVAGIEARRDRFQYHFDNPSSFDTPAPVPHFFEQRYVADNVWALLTVRYTARLRWETSFGATPQRTSTADDYDTGRPKDGDAQRRLSVDGELTPLSIGRLAVRLPEKYAGDVVFSAKVVGASGRATLARRGVRWPVEITLDAGRTWSYRAAARLICTQLGLRFAVGRAW